jgi:hypothetical protein
LEINNEDRSNSDSGVAAEAVSSCDTMKVMMKKMKSREEKDLEN